jgi:hypothetical protein
MAQQRLTEGEREEKKREGVGGSDREGEEVRGSEREGARLLQ